MKATVLEGESALQKHANTIEITNIRSQDFRGLYKIHLMENMLREEKDKLRTNNLTLQLDVKFDVEDE